MTAKFPGVVIVGQTLRNQERPIGEILRKVLAEIENHLLRRAAAIGLSDFLHDVSCDCINGLHHVESSKTRRFQLRSYDSRSEERRVGKECRL